MDSRIGELSRLLPPPSSPRNNHGNWSEVETALGTCLPADYKQFTELYGTVKICDYLVIHTAFPWSNEFKTFLLSQGAQYDAVVDGRANVPFPDFPTAGGLLAFGGTDQGDIFGWITEGEADDWGIFVWNFPGLSTYTFKNVNLTSFVVDLVSMSSPLFPDEMPPVFFSPENCRLVVTN